METIHFWTSSLSHLILAVNVLLCVVYRRQLPLFFRWFTYFLLTGLVIQIAAKTLQYQKQNNLPLLHLYTLLEFIFLSLFYGVVLKVQRLAYFRVFVVIIILLIISNSLFVQPITTFNSIAKTATQLIYIGYAVFYFFRIPAQEDRLVNLINSAVLIYYSGSLFIFMFTSAVVGRQDFVPYHPYLWLVNVGFYLLFQLIVLYALWTTVWPRKKSSL